MNGYQEDVSKVCIAIIVLFTFCIKSLEAQVDDIPYSTRPSVLDIEPIKLIQTPELSQFSEWIDKWPNIRKGYMFFLAEILTFYSDADFYFLARDAEYLYDIAVVLKQEIPQIQNKFHIIPISSRITKSFNKQFAIKYLQQEGLYSKDTRIKSAVIVDTCCRGSVINYIRFLFSGSKNESKIKGHLLSRHDNRNDFISWPENSESKIFKNIIQVEMKFVENYPHYFSFAATHYSKMKNKIEIMMPSMTDPLERRLAIQFMADIRHYFTQEQVKADFKDILQKMRTVFNYMTTTNLKEEKAALEALKALEQNYSIQPLHLLQDIMDYLKKDKNSFIQGMVDYLEKDKNWFKGKSALDYIKYIYLLLRNQCVMALTSNPKK